MSPRTKSKQRQSQSALSSPIPSEELAPFTLEFFVEDDGRPVVLGWFRSLSLTKKQILGSAMREILQVLGVGVCGTEFGKQLGKGLFEFRLRQKAGEIHHGNSPNKLPPEHVLLRVFCHAYGNRIVLLLGGYDKALDPSPRRQNKEIEEARARLARWKAREMKPLKST